VWPRVVAFVLGVAVAPHVSKAIKPVSREAMKRAVRLGDRLRRTAAEVREDLQDLAAEAAAELESEPDARTPQE